MSQKKAVIFDMDGVLIDSEPVYLKYMIDFMAQDGIVVQASDLVEAIGNSAKKTNELIYSFYNNSCTFEEFEKRLRSYVFPGLPYESIKNQHLPFILKELKQQGLKLGVASSSSPKEIERAMEGCGIDAYMDITLSGHTFKETKPHPEIYLQAAELLGVLPKECIVIEDSFYGIEAGKRAGMLVLAKQEPRFHFDQSQADYIINDLDEIVQYIHS